MKYFEVGKSGVTASNIVMGCMRLKNKNNAEAEKIIRTYMDEGVNYFDHADIYGGGTCEEIFGKAVDLSNASLREKMIIQSKCGISKAGCGSYDFSREHIIEAVDGSLKRLGTEYLDFLLLHRPDALMEPEEVAGAFEELYSKGKVRHFGVSNQTPSQIELLQSAMDFRLEANQLKLSIPHCPMIDEGLAANMTISQGSDFTGHVLEYSRLKHMTIQAWSPFQYGNDVSSSRSYPFLGDRERFPKLNDVIDRIAETHNVPSTAIAIAWITRHPADIQVILGSMNPERIHDACLGSDLPLTRAEWYELYQAGGKILP